MALIPTLQNLTIWKGDIRTIQVTIAYSDGTPLNLTGYTLSWRITTAPDINDTVLTKDITEHTDPENGISSIQFTSEDWDFLNTNKYYLTAVAIPPNGEEFTIMMVRLIIYNRPQTVGT